MFGINSNKIKNKLIFIELNELNFDFVKKYLQKKNNYKSLRKIVDFSSKTSSEQNYHNIEPWIQWVTAHTGLSYEEHRVFHLGEIGDLEQIFEKVENLNKSVGCISSMNVANNLKNATYFIPDPWCETKSDESFWSKLFVDFFKQTVKDTGLITANVSKDSGFMTKLFSANNGVAMNAGTKVEVSAVVDKLNTETSEIRLTIEEKQYNSMGGVVNSIQMYEPVVYQSLFNDIRTEVKRREAFGKN